MTSRNSPETMFMNSCFQIVGSQVVGGLKPALAERDKKKTMIDLRGISTTCLKTSYVPPGTGSKTVVMNS